MLIFTDHPENLCLESNESVYLFKLQPENCICGMFTVYKFIAELLIYFTALGSATATDQDLPGTSYTEITKLALMGGKDGRFLGVLTEVSALLYSG